MGCYHYIIDLVIAQKSPWLAELSPDEQAECSPHHASSGPEHYVEGADVFVVCREESTSDEHR